MDRTLQESDAFHWQIADLGAKKRRPAARMRSPPAPGLSDNGAMSDLKAPATLPRAQTCPRCGQPNSCAVEAGAPSGTCWCMHEPLPAPAAAREPIPADAACYCRACLRALRSESATA